MYCTVANDALPISQDMKRLMCVFLDRCFSCANSECSLSGRSINTPIAPCADMRCVDGFVQLKKHEKGYCLGCHRYPQCKQPSLWLPKCVKSGIAFELCLMLHYYATFLSL